jgi:putative RNA 2'-phosphotransferase
MEDTKERLGRKDRVLLSKAMSLRLRHRPGRFGLTLDGEGFAPLDDLVRSLVRWKEWMDADAVLEVVRRCEKGRFETRGGGVRCVYGHSFDEPIITYPPTQPPEIIFHGTSRSVLDGIMRDGLRPMGRQYVHLSTQTDMALHVGRRRDRDPVILTVRSGDAHRNGIRFYFANDLVVLADHVPPRYLVIPSGTRDGTSSETVT